MFEAEGFDADGDPAGGGLGDGADLVRVNALCLVQWMASWIYLFDRQDLGPTGFVDDGGFHLRDFSFFAALSWHWGSRFTVAIFRISSLL